MLSNNRERRTFEVFLFFSLHYNSIQILLNFNIFFRECANNAMCSWSSAFLISSVHVQSFQSEPKVEVLWCAAVVRCSRGMQCAHAHWSMSESCLGSTRDSEQNYAYVYFTGTVISGIWTWCRMKCSHTHTPDSHTPSPFSFAHTFGYSSTDTWVRRSWVILRKKRNVATLSDDTVLLPFSEVILIMFFFIMVACATHPTQQSSAC